jgi:hypothetical protein
MDTVASGYMVLVSPAVPSTAGLYRNRPHLGEDLDSLGETGACAGVFRC